MTGDRGPDPRFRSWLAGHAPDVPPPGLLPEVMRRIDASPQQRGWLPAWPLRATVAALATATVVVIAIAVGFAISDLAPDVGPPASASERLSPAASRAPSSSPSTVALDPTTIARIALPHAGTQTAFQVAVSHDRIWIVSPADGGHLVGIDTTLNTVASDVPIAPANLVTGDAGVWMVSPFGVAPEPESIDLIRVDEVTGEPLLVVEHPFADRLAVGLGHVWLGNSTHITKVDPDSGAEIATFPIAPLRLTVACGELWAWMLADGDEGRWTLRRLDPLSGEVLDEIVSAVGIGAGPVEIDGRCWVPYDDTLLEIVAGRGIVATVDIQPAGHTQIAGGALWSVRAANVIQRIDPTTGEGVGSLWQLPEGDLHEYPQGSPDWRLLSAGGSLWVLGAEWLVRYDIPTADEVASATPMPSPTAIPSPSTPAIPPAPSNPILGGEPVTDRDVDNSFTLVLTSNQDRYRAGQPIEVQATLDFTGQSDRVVAWGSGSGIVGFGLDSADGVIRIGPAGTSDCTETEIDAERPMVIAFVKSGGYGYDDPLASFYQAYFADPDLRLPAGIWTIRAAASFSTGSGCRGQGHLLETSITIVVEP